jgi:outer membrane protein assembly factor BamB
MKPPSLAAALAVLLSGSICSAAATPWPAWRGPSGSGISDDKNLPLQWNDRDNVRWRIPLPGPGNSTPIVWGHRVFLTQAVGNRRTLICFDRADGKLLWQSGVTYTQDEPTHRSNPYCAASPVTDGERVIAFFGSAGLFCYDLEGKELWRRDLGKISHMGGSGSSPILHRNACIINFGPGENAALIAVDKHSGVTLWRADMPGSATEHAPATSRQTDGHARPGSGRFLAWAMFTGADTDQDEQITAGEFSELAQRWFEASDPDKSGVVDEDKLIKGLNRVVGQPPNYARQGQPAAERPAPGPLLAPVLLNRIDTDQDSQASRAEFTAAFQGWLREWDTDKSGTVTPDEFRPGLMRSLIMPRDSGEEVSGVEGPAATWSTPVVPQVDGHHELIMTFPGRVAGFDPATGKELWSVKGLGTHVKPSPVYGEGIVVALGGGPRANALAVKPGGNGSVDDTHRIWLRERFRNRIGSGVIHQGYFYSVSEVGIAECLDLKTGKTIWEERLKGHGSGSSVWSSIVLAGGRLYVPVQSGEVFVLRASPKFEVLAINSTGKETINASLAVSDGAIFIRTFQDLWCIANKSP